MIKPMICFLFCCRELSKPLLPAGRAGVLFSEILHLLCKQMVSVPGCHSQRAMGKAVGKCEMLASVPKVSSQ